MKDYVLLQILFIFMLLMQEETRSLMLKDEVTGGNNQVNKREEGDRMDFIYQVIIPHICTHHGNMRRSEENCQGSVLFFHHVGPGGGGGNSSHQVPRQALSPAESSYRPPL